MVPSDESLRPNEPTVIPDGASPLRFLTAAADGSAYLSYRTLEQAQEDQDATMVFEADSGGQILLSCPVKQVRAEKSAIEQLLVDLEMITWGMGYDPDQHSPSDAEVYFEHLSVGSRIAGGMGGGGVVDGVWLHPEVEELGLREQIEAIISGHSPRLVLAPEFPEVDLGTLAATHRVPFARVHLWSSRRGQLLVNCLATTVRANETRLVQLIRQLDTVLDLVHPVLSSFDPRVEPRLAFIPAERDMKRGGGHHLAAPLVLGSALSGRPLEALERNREAIGRIIDGGEAEIS